MEEDLPLGGVMMGTLGDVRNERSESFLPNVPDDARRAPYRGSYRRGRGCFSENVTLGWIGGFSLRASMVALLACGGAVDPAANKVPEDAAPAQDAFSDARGSEVAPDAKDAPDGQPGAEPDADCWRCVDTTWWDVCQATPVRAPDAESCLYCGGHCDGG